MLNSKQKSINIDVDSDVDSDVIIEDSISEDSNGLLSSTEQIATMIKKHNTLYNCLQEDTISNE